MDRENEWPSELSSFGNDKSILYSFIILEGRGEIAETLVYTNFKRQFHFSRLNNYGEESIKRLNHGWNYGEKSRKWMNHVTIR